MAYTKDFVAIEPARDEIDALREPLVIEFGTPWCPHCQGAQPTIEAAFKDHPQVRHIKVEDGKGRRLGRSFQVKLWPTLIFMRGGQEVGRLVRPTEAPDLAEAMRWIAG